MLYFKRYWNELRGDEHDDWGCSWWYFETNDDGDVLRQIEVYDSGPALKYSELHVEDEYGGLSEKPLDLAEFAEFTTRNQEFERAWNS